MSERRDCRDYLADMHDAIESIRDFTKDMTYDEFVDDKKTVFA